MRLPCLGWSPQVNDTSQVEPREGLALEEVEPRRITATKKAARYDHETTTSRLAAKVANVPSSQQCPTVH
jgi:hypothetical protein